MGSPTVPRFDSPMSRQQAFESEGYLVVRGALEPAEVERLRSEVRRAVKAHGIPFGLGQAVPNAAVDAPDAGWVFAHPRILAGVREALGTDELAFVMEAGLHRNATGFWHKDTGEAAMPGGYYGCADPYSRPDCRVVKVGVYLQDHIDGTGLTIRVGSHRSPSLGEGSETVLEHRAGDAVIFDVRITHHGAVPTRVDRAIVRLADRLPSGRRDRVVATTRHLAAGSRGRRDRLAAFFAYGPATPMTDAYARRNLDRQLLQTGGSSRAPDPAIARRLTEAGVALADVGPG